MCQNKTEKTAAQRFGTVAGSALLLGSCCANAGVLSPAIFLTGQKDLADAVEAMKAGAADYLVNGQIDPPLLERAIRACPREIALRASALQQSQTEKYNCAIVEEQT